MLTNTECLENQQSVAIIKLLDETEEKLNGKYLFESAISAIDDGVIEFQNGIAAIMVNNETDKPMSITQFSEIGTVRELRDFEEIIDLNRTIGVMATKTEIRTELMSRCICKLGGKSNKGPIQLFFLQNPYMTSFRHYDLINDHGGMRLSHTTITRVGDSLYIDARKKITLEMVEKALSKYDMSDNRAIHCYAEKLEDMGLMQYETLSLFTHFTTRVHLRYFQEGRRNSLCPNHRYLDKINCNSVRILILNKHSPKMIMSGCKTVSCFELGYVKVQHMIGSDTHHFILHVPEMKLGNKHMLFGALYRLFGEFQKVFQIWPWVFIESMETPCISEDYKSMVSALQMIRLPRSKIRTDLYDERKMGQEKGATMTLKYCACKHCNAEYNNRGKSDPKIRRMSLGQALKTEKVKDNQRIKVSHIDFFEIPKENATPSAFSFEKRCEPEPLATNEHIEETGTEGYKQVDMTTVPAEEKEFFEELVHAFKHVFFTKSQFRMIRDRRVKLHLEMDVSKLPKKEVYDADKTTAMHIEQMFHELCERKIAKVCNNTSEVLHYSPCYIRIRSTMDMDMMRKDPNYVPKKRLISNYAGLNKGILNNPPITYHSLRNLILSTGQTKYSGTADIRSCFRSFPVTKHVSRYLCIVTPSNTVYKVLQCIEGISIVPAFVTSHIMDSLVFSSPMKKDVERDMAEYAKNPQRPLNSVKDLAAFLKVKDKSKACPMTKTKPYLEQKDAKSSIYESDIEAIHDAAEKVCHTARVITRDLLNPNLYVKENSCVSFIDDARLFSQDKEDYRRVLISFLIDINNMGLSLAGEKFKPYAIYDSKGSVEFLGFKVYSDHYEARQERIESLKTLTYPTTIKGMQKCLGCFQFLSEGCDSLMVMASKLYDRMAQEKKGKSFELTQEEKHLFDTIVAKLSENKPMYIPDPKEDLLCIETDSSTDVYAAVLYAITKTQERKVISYYSKKFPTHYRKSLSIPMKEMIAIISSFHYWRLWIYSYVTCYRGDCLSIISLMLHRRASDDLRLERMLIKLRSYPIRYVCHVRTDQNASDILTRMKKYEAEKPPFTTPTKFEKSNNQDLHNPLIQGRMYKLEEMETMCYSDPKAILPTINMDVPNDLNLDEMEAEPLISAIVRQETSCLQDLTHGSTTFIEGVQTEGTTPGAFRPHVSGISVQGKLHNFYTTNHLKPITTEFIMDEQSKDDAIKGIIKEIKFKKQIPVHLQKYTLFGGNLLLRKSKTGLRIVLNEKMAMRIFTQIHFMTHCSAQKLIKITSRFYYVKRIKDIAEKVCSACHFCAVTRERSKPNFLPGMIPRGTKPLEHLSLDFVTFSRKRFSDGRTYIGFLNCMDHYSHFTFAIPVTNQKTSTVISLLRQIHQYFGLHGSTLHFDNATAFNNEEIINHLKAIDAKAKYIVPYCHFSSGTIEAGNKMIRRLLTIYDKANKQSFADTFRDVIFAMNVTPRGVFGKSGLIPYEVMYKRSPYQIVNIVDDESQKQLMEQTKDEIEKLMVEGQLELANLAKMNERLLDDQKGITKNSLVLLRRYKDTKAHRDKQLPAYQDDVVYKVLKRAGHHIQMVDVKNPENIIETSIRFLKLYTDRSHPIFKHLLQEQMHNLGNPEGSDGELTLPKPRFKPKPYAVISSSDSNWDQHLSVSQAQSEDDEPNYEFPLQKSKGNVKDRKSEPAIHSPSSSVLLEKQSSKKKITKAYVQTEIHVPNTAQKQQLPTLSDSRSDSDSTESLVSELLEELPSPVQNVVPDPVHYDYVDIPSDTDDESEDTNVLQPVKNVRQSKGHKLKTQKPKSVISDIMNKSINSIKSIHKSIKSKISTPPIRRSKRTTVRHDYKKLHSKGK